MKTQHTPGPDLDNLKKELSIIQEAARLLTSKHCDRPDSALNTDPYKAIVRNGVNDFLWLESKGFFLVKANASLIAAAPELLEALVDSESALKDWIEWYDQVRSVTMSNTANDYSAPYLTGSQMIDRISSAIKKAKGE